MTRWSKKLATGNEAPWGNHRPIISVSTSIRRNCRNKQS